MMRMHDIARTFLIAVFLSAVINNAQAATIILTSGRRVDGKIIKETDSYIILDTSDLQIMYSKWRIAEVIPDDFSGHLSEQTTPIRQAEPALKQEESFVVQGSNLPSLKRRTVAREQALDKKVKQEIDAIRKAVNGSISSRETTIKPSVFFQIAGIKLEMEDFLKGYNDVLDEAYEDNPGSLMNIILEGTSYMEDVVNDIKQIAQDDGSVLLTTSMISYYEKLIELQSVVLRSFVSKDGSVAPDIVRVSKDVEFWEKQFLQEFNRTAQQFAHADEKEIKEKAVVDGLDAISTIAMTQGFSKEIESIQGPEDSGNKEGRGYLEGSEVLKDIKLLQQEKETLIKKMESLADVNRALRDKSELLIQDNNMLKERLQLFLESDLNKLTIEQKREFLRYLDQI